MSTISLTIQKTKTYVTLPLSKSAIKLLRSIKKESYLVFPDLSEYILNKEIPLLIEKAKIKKHITFHCFRHTFAMSLLNKGTDILGILSVIFSAVGIGCCGFQFAVIDYDLPLRHGIHSVQGGDWLLGLHGE